MEVVIFVAKVCVCVFFGAIFIGNLISLSNPKKSGTMNFNLYLVKQLWIVISLLVIAIVLEKL